MVSVKKEVLEALQTGKYNIEKLYSDISKVEFDMRFPEMASAIISYYEDGKLKTDVERVQVVLISPEGSVVSPEIFITAYTSKVDIKNPNESVYAMAGIIQSTLLARALKLTIGHR